MSTVAELPFVLREPEIQNLHGTDTGRDHLSHSSIGTLLACEQRFNLHYEQGLRPAVTATPLALGRGFAEALAAGEPEIGFQVVLNEHLAEAEANRGNPWVTVRSHEEALEGATLVRAASRAYLDRYGQHGETRELELRARIRNPAQGGRYSQTHDLVARVDAVNVLAGVLIEDKLASSQSRVGLDRRVKLDRQVSIGTYLLWRCLGITTHEIRYRVTLKPSIRQRQNETHDQFLERLEDDYATRPDFYCHEEITSRTKVDFLRLERELWRWAERVRDNRRDGVYPRNVGACGDYGGCRFVAVCCDEPGALEQFRVQEFGEESESQEIAA